MAPILLRSSCIIQDLITQSSSITSSVITYFSLHPCYSGLGKLLFKPNSWEKKKKKEAQKAVYIPSFSFQSQVCLSLIFIAYVAFHIHKVLYINLMCNVALP